MTTCERCGLDFSVDGDLTELCSDCAYEENENLRFVIELHLPALKKMGNQIIHPKQNVFSKMVADFEVALARCGPKADAVNCRALGRSQTQPFRSAASPWSGGPPSPATEPQRLPTDSNPAPTQPTISGVGSVHTGDNVGSEPAVAHAVTHSDRSGCDGQAVTVGRDRPQQAR